MTRGKVTTNRNQFVFQELTVLPNYGMMFDDLGSPDVPLGPDDMMEEMSEMPRTPSPPHPQPVQKGL
jgi:hypothetical protein